jgi:hypothetical protein
MRILTFALKSPSNNSFHTDLDAYHRGQSIGRVSIDLASILQCLSTHLFSFRCHLRRPLAPLLITPFKLKGVIWSLHLHSPWEESAHHSRGLIPANLLSTLTLTRHSIEGRTIHISPCRAPGTNLLTPKTAIRSCGPIGEMTDL